MMMMMISALITLIGTVFLGMALFQSSWPMCLGGLVVTICGALLANSSLKHG